MTEGLRAHVTLVQAVLTSLSPIIFMGLATQFNYTSQIYDSEYGADEMNEELLRLNQILQDQLDINIPLQRLVDINAEADIVQTYITLFEHQIKMRLKIEDLQIDLFMTKKYTR